MLQYRYTEQQYYSIENILTKVHVVQYTCPSTDDGKIANHFLLCSTHLKLGVYYIVFTSFALKFHDKSMPDVLFFGLFF
jgi:hypothetical protein